MFSVAYLQDPGNGRLRLEEQLLESELTKRGVAVEFYTIKKIQRRILPLCQNTFIAGDMDAMHGAMKQLNIEIPSPNDYPECLVPYLHRRVWKDVLASVEHRIFSECGAPVFAKPSTRRKSFTGRVFASPSDFMYLGGSSRRQEVWCSEVVSWIAEYRVYVVNDGIVAVDLYDGTSDAALDMRVVNDAVRSYRESCQAPSAYGIDFGVLSSGQTALIEVNDGYSLGAYAIEAKSYTDLLMTRWHELLRTSGA